MMRRIALPASALALMVFATGCLADRGETCQVDSDCATGLVCGLDFACTTFGQIEASFDVVEDVEVITFDTGTTGSNTGTSDVDLSQCEEIEGVFDPGPAPCPGAPIKKKVIAVILAAEGGITKLAPVGNPVLEDGFANGNIRLEYWIDGDEADGCPRKTAWWRSSDDLNGDCTPVHSTTMPVELPNLAFVLVDPASFDFETRTVTGLVDEEQILDSLDESLRDTAAQLIDENVDTDGDGVPDLASVKLQVFFEGDTVPTDE